MLEYMVDRDRVESVASLLRTIDLTSVDKKVTQKFVDVDYVHGLREETIRFLSIALGSRGSLAPSQPVDEYWHEMILNTPLYASLSQQMGAFVHHSPSEVPDVTAYQRTLSAYQAVFGELNPTYWKLDSIGCETTGPACTSPCETTGPGCSGDVQQK